MSEPESSSNSVKQLLTKALHRVLCPLVKIVVRHGVTFAEFAEVLKRAYVEEVQKELTRTGERTTLSRISVVSGVHRKDVKRLTELDAEEDISRSKKVSLTARLLSNWTGDARFLDKQGNPLTLARSGIPSFELLVSSVSSDIRPRTVLDDWLQKGIIEETSEGYRLIPDALFPSQDITSKIAFFARNTADHIATIEHNLREEEEAFLERSVFYNRLSTASVTELQQQAKKESQTLLLKINKQAQVLAQRDDASKTAEENNQRFILGTYFYQEEEEHKRDQD